jgi:hypothetical protein
MRSQFEGPIPGQSLAGDKDMGSYPWENPPDFPDPDEFYEFTVNKLLNDEENLMNVVKLLEMEIPVNTIADGLLMNSFMMGQITPQVAIISKEPVMELLMLIAQEAEVQPVLSDPSIGRNEETQIDAAMEELAGQAPPDDMMAEEGEESVPPPMGMMAPPPEEDMMMAEEVMDTGEVMPPLAGADEELLLEDV